MVRTKPPASRSKNLTITESVSPYTTTEPGCSSSTLALVCSIMARPMQVVRLAMGRQGSMPVAKSTPVKPYTELADTLSASWRAFCRPRSCSVAALFMAFLAFLRCARMRARISGSTPRWVPDRTMAYGLPSTSWCFSTPSARPARSISRTAAAREGSTSDE